MDHHVKPIIPTRIWFAGPGLRLGFKDIARENAVPTLQLMLLKLLNNKLGIVK